jgi:uncharacterized protein (TIGR00730 family)
VDRPGSFPDSPAPSEPPDASRPVVAVFGAASVPPDGPEYRTAYALGAAVARRGWVLASGGYGGTMAAASRGAAEAGGHTLGVTCDTLHRAGRSVNPWVKEEIRRPTARERLVTLCRRADAAVALNGGIGTLSEIAFFAAQIQTGELSPRPLLLLGAMWKPVLQSFFRAAGSRIGNPEKALFAFASSPEEAADFLGSRLSPS